MQILNNILLDSEALLLPTEAVARLDTTSKGPDISSDLNLEQAFSELLVDHLSSILPVSSSESKVAPVTADYYNNQVLPVAVSPAESQATAVEAVFPSAKETGQILPLSDLIMKPPLPGSEPVATNLNKALYNLQENLPTKSVTESFLAADISQASESSDSKVKSILKSLDSDNVFNEIPKDTRQITSSPLELQIKNSYKDIVNIDQNSMENIGESIDIEADFFLAKNKILKTPEKTEDGGIMEKSLLSFSKLTTNSISNHETTAINNSNKANYTVTVDDNFAEQFNEKIELLIRNNQKEAKISLDPEGLGKIDVQIKMNNNDYVVNIFTQNESAQQILDQHANKLKQFFSDENLKFNLSQQQDPNYSQPDSDKHNLKEHRPEQTNTNLKHKNSINHIISSNVNHFVSQSGVLKQSINLYV